VHSAVWTVREPDEIPQAANRVLRYVAGRVRVADSVLGAKLLGRPRTIDSRTCGKHLRPSRRASPSSRLALSDRPGAVMRGSN
jgi:hypothetical protein